MINALPPHAMTASGRKRSATGFHSVGHGIVVPPSGWTFGGEVWRGFDQHIRASVPGYDSLHEQIVRLACPYLGAKRRACDFGCSTGTLTERLVRQYPQAEVWGVDIEPSMIAAAKRVSPARPRYVCSDLRQLRLPPLHFATVCYTMMFLPLADRLPLLARLADALVPGGGLVLAEKVKRSDPENEAQCQRQHYAFKRSQGLSAREIAAKAFCMETAMAPLYESENLALLDRAGFGEIRLISREACFDAWLAVRRT